MSPFLTRCAQATAGTATQISYPTVIAAKSGDLGLLHNAIGNTLDRLLGRQAVLAAIDAEGRTNDAVTYCNGVGGPMFLVSSNTPIRSSHSGAPVDAGLPQGPYDAAPAAATAGIRGRANWAWLRESTTPHTTDPGTLPANPNRVASYFELHVPTIKDGAKQVQLDGGRLVYDPFNQRYFLSSHYAAQYELINVPTLGTVPVFQTIRTEIQAYANGQVGGLPPWSGYFKGIDDRIRTGAL
ncbi:MAG TPA: hypothetical protein VLH10_25160 [Yinghuangia sp.]|uniref:hypothetical protein n=1 Tax=Yinghuangia sp. YIM S10712 TaxID=3436930 RepID=UPI002C2C53D8|nr:hypothetical protein [Yinghuangia sp.]